MNLQEPKVSTYAQSASVRSEQFGAFVHLALAVVIGIGLAGAYCLVAAASPLAAYTPQHPPAQPLPDYLGARDSPLFQSSTLNTATFHIVKPDQSPSQVVADQPSTMSVPAGLSFAAMSSTTEPGIGVMHINIDDFVSGGRLTSGYCERVRNGVRESHPGVDIAATTVVTVTAGIAGHVEATYPFDGHHYPADSSGEEWLRNFNTVVISNAASQRFYVYGHFAQILAGIAVSTNVQADTPIGLIGGMGAMSATTFGPHLHLEIREDIGPAGWGDEEIGLVTSGSKDHAINPLPTFGPNLTATVISTATHWQYHYEIINDPSSDPALPIWILRIGYGSEQPYQVNNVPPGWTHSVWENKPQWVEFYALDWTAAVPPGDTQGGFGFVSQGIPGQVPFFVEYDDAGHTGGLGARQVTVLGVAGDLVAWLPVVIRGN
jgi:murein DD-endopeptidase MepM/ murein hydrolase activator NlpD